MASIKDKIERHYKIPCGPMDISADAVCRRNLKSSLDALLDRITEDINPEPLRSKVPKDAVVSDDGKTFVIGSFKEETVDKANLQGNSKLLQDATGKMAGWREG